MNERTILRQCSTHDVGFGKTLIRSVLTTSVNPGTVLLDIDEVLIVTKRSRGLPQEADSSLILAIPISGRLSSDVDGGISSTLCENHRWRERKKRVDGQLHDCCELLCV